MAESIALAVLENLVHMTRQDFPRGYVCVAAVLPDGISILNEKDLRKQPALADLNAEQLGDWWLDSGASAVQQVPSFVIVLRGTGSSALNPVHSEFANQTRFRAWWRTGLGLVADNILYRLVKGRRRMGRHQFGTLIDMRNPQVVLVIPVLADASLEKWIMANLEIKRVGATKLTQAYAENRISVRIFRI